MSCPNLISRLIAFGLAVFTVISLAPAAAASGQGTGRADTRSAERAFCEGLDANRAKKWAEAERSFKRAIAAHDGTRTGGYPCVGVIPVPFYPEYELGLALFSQGKFEEALKPLEAARSNRWFPDRSAEQKTDQMLQQAKAALAAKPGPGPVGPPPAVAGRLSIKVADQAGKLLPGLSVQLAGPLSQTAVTNNEGEVSFVNLPVGRYTVAIDSKLFRPYRTTDVDVRGGADSTLTVGLTPNAPPPVLVGQVNVRVTDRSNRPLAGAAVQLTGGQSATAVADERGEAHFVNLAPGRYRVSVKLVRFGELSVTESDVTVTAGAVSPVTVAMTPVVEPPPPPGPDRTVPNGAKLLADATELYRRRDFAGARATLNRAAPGDTDADGRRRLLEDVDRTEAIARIGDLIRLRNLVGAQTQLALHQARFGSHPDWQSVTRQLRATQQRAGVIAFYSGQYLQAIQFLRDWLSGPDGDGTRVRFYLACAHASLSLLSSDANADEHRRTARTFYAGLRSPETALKADLQLVSPKILDLLRQQK